MTNVPERIWLSENLVREVKKAKWFPEDAHEYILAAAQDEQFKRHEAEITALQATLAAARAHCISWQGEPDDLSCSIHRAVIAKIDTGLANNTYQNLKRGMI